MEIRLEQVQKKIGGITVLNKITLTMQSGTIYGLQGPNGSGKTMLMRMITGLIRPTSGTVLIDGKRLGEEIDFPEDTGLLLENPAFLEEYTGKRNLQLLASIQGKIGEEKIEKTMIRVGLNPKDKRKYRKYSLGMKEKLGIAAVVMEEPDLVILDEPFNALDRQTVEKIKDLIREERERGALVVLACHDAEILEDLADELIYLENGEMI